MDENIKSNYYAIIPATVRYDKGLTDKAKLLYGEITCLCNKEGYCFATNNYFANLYNCTSRAIQFTISKLQEKGYIRVILENNYQRKIYLTDAIGHEKNFTLSHENSFTGGYEKIFTNNNIKYNIDDLFILIINNSNEISREFYSSLRRLEFIYPKAIIETMEESNLVKIKEIIYTLFLIYNSNFKNIILKFDRENLIKLYLSCKSHNTDDFFNYYKRAIINKYTDTS